MCGPVIAEQIVTGGSAINTVGYVPVPSRAQNITIYIVTSAGVSAGAVTVEEAPAKEYTGTWVASASAVTTSAANTVYKVTLSGVAVGALRARISTAITGGTVDIHVVGN